MDEFIIGLRLAKLRQNMGLSQEQVAERALLNLKDYQAMEEGKLLDDQERLKKACKAMGIKVEDLLDSNTFVHYGNNTVESGANNLGNVSSSYNVHNTFNNRNEEDITFMKDIANNLKLVSEHLDVLNTSIIHLFERLDDNVLKKKLENISKDSPNKSKGKGN